MQDYQLFEYAIIRIVPKVERQEFLNAGVILFCAGARFLQVRAEISFQKIHTFSATIDLEDLKLRLDAMEHICNGNEDSGPIGQLPLASRFRWLTSTRSTVVQTSPVHPGFCKDPASKLNKLFAELVM